MYTLIDLREERKKRNFSPLSEYLQERIGAMLKTGKQTLLFLNRRGMANSLVCETCGDIIECSNCDVSMTYHRKAADQQSRIKHFLMCHYCGKTIHVPDTCPACRSNQLKPLGYGTQQLELEVQKLFPQACIGRLDKDSTSGKLAGADILERFETQDLDILIGTQMISKGHDFANVALIGIILADVGLSIPDFRAKERTYQVLTQVAGRTGRRGEAGEVVLQTFNPEDITVDMVDEHSYHKLYTQELAEREQFNYPPFTSMIQLTYRNPNRSKALEASKQLLTMLKAAADNNHTITMAPAMIPKQHGNYHMHILLKGPDPRGLLTSLLPLPRGWRVDVDPA